MEQSFLFKDIVDLLLDLVHHIQILHSRGHLVFLVVAHFADDVSQIFARSCFGESRDYVAVFEACYRADLFSYEINYIFGYLLRIVCFNMLGFDCYKGHRYLSFDLVSNTNNYSLSNKRMGHYYLLHLSSRQSMTGSVDNIIFPRHNMEISIFIFEARVTCIVVPLQCVKVLLDIFVIVIEDRMHE